ncbi:MAG: hypothetical protein LIP28_01745 [Deltaproteobacteria bacterium]|nr:hypothetical protein [Deltaproteobacteria bacterium]
MKIQNEQLQALQRQAEAKAKKQQAGGLFDALLSEELGSAAAPGQTASGQAPAASTALLGLNGVPPTGTVEETPEGVALAAVAQSIDAMLSGLDEYAGTLSSPQGADLRKAYGILRDMDKTLDALRESTPDLATRHGGMAALLDEISVITRAETVKMNRGDYL